MIKLYIRNILKKIVLANLNEQNEKRLEINGTLRL